MTRHIDRYEILGRIGRGGMGSVYRAWDPFLEREVALKMISAETELSEELRRRFLREAEACARLSHPNIVTIHDIGEVAGQLFIIMELLDGDNLHQIMAEARPMSLEQQLALMVDVCDGLHYAHRMGIVHRDVKPQNIVVLRTGQAKIVDFGIARLATGVEGNLTRAGLILGTPRYMAPEQVQGRADHRSDIFAVGAVCYELLGGRRAFPGENTFEVLEQLRAMDPPCLSGLNRGVPPELAAIVARALEKEPGRRFADLSEMREATERVARTLAAAAERRPDAVAATGAEREARAECLSPVDQIDEVAGAAAEIPAHVRARPRAAETALAAARTVPTDRGAAGTGLPERKGASPDAEAAGADRQTAPDPGSNTCPQAPPHVLGPGQPDESSATPFPGPRAEREGPSSDRPDETQWQPGPPDGPPTSPGSAEWSEPAPSDPPATQAPHDERTAHDQPDALPAPVAPRGPRHRHRRQIAVSAMVLFGLAASATGYVWYRGVLSARIAQVSPATSRAAMVQARDLAVAADAEALAPGALATGDARAAEASRLARAGESSAAAHAYHAAARSYAAAAQEAESRRRDRAEADRARERMLVDKQRAESSVPAFSAALAREREGTDRYQALGFREAATHFLAAATLFATARSEPTGARSSPSGVARPDARTEIRTLLEEYVRAVETKNLDHLIALRPTITPQDRTRLRRSFAMTRTHTITLTIYQITLRGDDAEAVGKREDRIILNDGQRVQTETAFHYTLARRSDRWIIRDIQDSRSR